MGTMTHQESTTPIAIVYGLSTTISGLNDTTAYYFYVTGTNNIGESPPSAEVSSTPTALTGPSMGLTYQPNPTSLGATTKITASISGTRGTPTGTVAFSDGATPITGCTALNATIQSSIASQAVCTTSFATGGPHTISAVYSGDSNYLTQNATVQVVVNAVPTTTVLTDSAGGLVSYGGSDTFTASIVPQLSGVNVSGTVSFNLDGSSYAPCTDQSVSATLATCFLPAQVLPVGTHHVTATFSPTTPNLAASTSQTYTVITAARPTTTTLVAAPTSLPIGQSSTLTATINTDQNATTPTGTVSFYDGGQPIAGCTGLAVQTTSTTTATCTALITTALAHALTATYSGDSNFSPSTGATSITATAAATTTTLTVTPSPAPVGSSATLTATVNTPVGVPTGSVAFYHGSTPIAGCATQPLAQTGATSATATCVTTFAQISTQSLSATYSGDSNYTTSTSQQLSFVVSPGPSTTTLAALPQPTVVGLPTTLTATVTGGGVSPTGTVTFSTTAGIIPTCANVPTTAITTSAATASCLTIFTAAGAQTIVATYSGDSNYTPSSGSIANPGLTVAQATPTISVTPTPSPTTVTTPVTITAVISGSGVPPTGTVTISDGLTQIPGCINIALVLTPSQTAKAVCVTSFTQAASHLLTATYPGDANYLTGTATSTLSVTAGPGPTHLTAAPADQSVALHWNIPATGSATLTGYQVYMGTAAGQEAPTPVATPATNTVTITGLNDNTTYYFTVVAITNVGPTLPSNEVSATPLPAPLAPIGLTGTAGNTTANLSWSAPTTGTAPEGYQLFFANQLSSPIATVSALTTNYTVTGLHNGTTYSFVVVATSLVGPSPASNVAQVTPQAPKASGHVPATGGTKLSAYPQPCAATPNCGYIVLLSGQGDLAVYGGAPYYGSMYGKHLNQPMVAVTYTPDGKGYWEVASDGGVFTYGAATFYGSTGGTTLNAPVTGIAPTHDGRGYWLVASDGGIFAFGDATFYGSMGATPLNQPIVSVAATPDGKGYWLVAADGGLFAFGDARFYGSMGGIYLNSPIVGLTPTPDGNGYWEVASDGGVFAYGDAQFSGSGVNNLYSGPAIGMFATADNAYSVISDIGASTSF
jgi:hypothetical protein